jgi:two-component system phosphate regulon sensor histidine kinase PhoR
VSDYWQRALTFPLLSLLLSLFVWAIFGPLIATSLFVLLLLIRLLAHLRNLAALDRWSTSPDTLPIPEGSGLWSDVFSNINKMVKQQRKERDQHASALLQIEQATAALPEGVIILERSDRIEWCNPLAEKHFGLDGVRDIGQQITYLARQPEFIQYLSDGNYTENLVLRKQQRDELVLSIKVIPYGNHKKLLTSRDITHLELIETMRRDFVANVSHELRTPLTVVNGFVETMHDMTNLENSMARRALQLMGDQTKRMESLVDDLLTLSRLENSNNALQEETIHILDLVKSVFDDGVALSAGQHQLKLGRMDKTNLRGNSNELRSAFSNLVSNAVRYTPKGGEIELSWMQRDNGQPIFSVKDGGIGIAAEHIPRLTERFYRVDRSRSRETGGTGLGLAIVKHIALRHQAHLEIVSEEGHGSTFSIVFPRKRITQ